MTDATRHALIAQLEQHEGRRRFPYMDSVGKTTIGCGRNLSDKGLSEKEIDMLLEHDLDEVLADLETFSWFSTLDPVRQRVLADMRFNLGPSRFRGFKRMLRKVAEQDHVLAGAAMRNSLWYSQVRQRGVRLTQMMVTGEDA